MIRGLYTAVSGLISQEAKQDVITSNIANATTTGYKKDNLAIRKFDDVLLSNYDKVVGGRNVRNVIGSISLGSKIDETDTDFEQGDVASTDLDTDFAIQGNGFFAVTDAAGKTMYTRDGHFHVDSQGYLKSENGSSVMGADNAPIYVGNGTLSLDGDGNIYTDGKLAGKFNIVDFNDYKNLKKAGDNLYEGTGAVPATTYSLKNKALEKSNINVVNEMVNMMSVMRNFETNQKLVQTMDETLGKAVNDIGSLR